MKPLIILLLTCVSVLGGETIVTSQSEKKWNEIHERIKNRMGGEFIKTLEVNTGRPHTCNLSLQLFKTAFNIDFKVDNYYNVTFSGEPDVNGTPMMISVMVVKPVANNDLENRYKKLKSRTLPLQTINPNIGILSMNGDLLIMVSIGVLKLDDRAKAVISAIEDIDRTDPQAPQKPATAANQEQQNPIVTVITGAREFHSWNNQQLPKAASDEVLGVLERFAGTFILSERDCRVPDQGPMASLAPTHVMSFITPANENVTVALFVFSEKFSVLQISIDSKAKKYFSSEDKKLIGQFSKIMQKAPKH